jgi:hypothetical protein
MADKKGQKEYIRVTADFTPKAYNTLNEVAEKLSTNKADAIRRALGLILYVLDQQANGKKIILETEDGKNRTQIVTL